MFAFPGVAWRNSVPPCGNWDISLFAFSFKSGPVILKLRFFGGVVVMPQKVRSEESAVGEPEIQEAPTEAVKDLARASGGLTH